MTNQTTTANQNPREPFRFTDADGDYLHIGIPATPATGGPAISFYTPTEPVHVPVERIPELIAVLQRLAIEQPAVDTSEVCGKCRHPFDPTDTRYDGRARFYLTPYCRRCVAGCHDCEIADHRCVICQ